MTDVLDVLVVGGGPVGACAAALLVRGAPTEPRPLRVAVLEARTPTTPRPDEPLDSRVVAISRASERVLQAADAWTRLEPRRIEAYERMRIWHERFEPFSSGVLVFDAAEAGEPNLGYILEHRMLQTALLTAFTSGGGRVEHGALHKLQIEPEYVKVTTDSGDLFARLVIGGDGANSAVRREVGLTEQSVDLQQTAVVATVSTERAHEKTAWQRFMRDGTLAFLPLADGDSSIVWSADNSLAATLVAAETEEFEAALQQASGGALGAVRLRGQRISFPLQRLNAHRYIANRCALIGDAAHVVHPLAGQGVNLGLLDAAALAQVVLAAVREREDPAAPRVLRQYERWRKSEVALMSTAISVFDRFLAHGSGPVSSIAQRGLGWVNRSQEAKRFFAARALGVTGEIPRFAR